MVAFFNLSNLYNCGQIPALRSNRHTFAGDTPSVPLSAYSIIVRKFDAISQCIDLEQRIRSIHATILAARQRACLARTNRSRLSGNPARAFEVQYRLERAAEIVEFTQ